MQHLRLRCKHCHKEYTYCTYGNGPEWGTEEGCSMEYCAECQKAIDEALGKIPIKYTWKWLEIRPTLGLFEALTETKEKVEKERKESNMPIIVKSQIFCSTYDNADTYVRDGIEYLVEWNDSTPEDKHVHIKMEYNLENGLFTNKVWRVDTRETYCHTRPFKWEDKMIEVTPMAPPLGKLLYFDPLDFEWDIKTEPRQIKQPEHIRREYTLCFYGKAVKGLMASSGDRKCVFGCDNNVKPEDIYDFLEYKCSFISYDDEDFETITKIRVK